MLTDVSQDGGLQSTEAEIQIAFELRRVPIRVGEARRRERDGAIVTASGEPIDDRAAGVAEPQQFGDLVVRLARCIVASTADALIVAGRLPSIQARVAA